MKAYPELAGLSVEWWGGKGEESRVCCFLTLGCRWRDLQCSAMGMRYMSLCGVGSAGKHVLSGE